MSGMGEDVCVLAENQSVKVHVHAKRPGDVINHVMEIGRLGSVKIDSLLNTLKDNGRKLEYGVSEYPLEWK